MTAPETARLATLWGRLLVEELARCGVTHACISPGSRSTPLTAAAVRSERLACTLWLDERGAAYHALGIARATGRPAALVCTSGTAAANYLPAVVEAAQDGVPLLVLTADRPPELLDTGANQAIRQSGIFGGFVRWAFDLPVPDPGFPAAALLSTVDHAVHRALGPPAGPVHLNCMFREPLGPTGDEPWPADVPERWRAGDRPLTAYARPGGDPAAAAVAAVAAALREARRGLLLVGQLPTAADRAAAARLAGRLGWPVAADVRSGLRLGAAPATLVPHLDQLLLAPGLREAFAPDVVLHLGAQPVSKRLAQALAARPPAARIAVQENPFRSDPDHAVSLRLDASPGRLCELLLAEGLAGEGGSWGAGLAAASARAGEQIDRFVAGAPLGEIAVARLVSRELPDGHGLFLGNSMPIRDMDMYGAVRAGAVPVAANRGASGIDGTVSTAAGFAQGLGAPATLVAGDLTVLHDLNALGELGVLARPLVVVLVNNGGGGIFHFLPIAAQGDLLDPWFTAPQTVNFGGVAQLFGIPHHRPGSAGEFVAAYREACAAGKPAVIEVRSDRVENLAAHRELGERIAAAGGEPGS